MSGSGPGDWRQLFGQPSGAARGCVFCEIVLGSRPAHIVFRDDWCTGFLDSRPLFPGHVLIVPLRHVETLTDLDRELVAPLFIDVKMVAEAVEEAMHADGTFVAINNRVSQSVPHLHVHVVPRRRGDNLKGFFWPRTKYSSEEHAERVAKTISAKIKELLKQWP